MRLSDSCAISSRWENKNSLRRTQASGLTTTASGCNLLPQSRAFTLTTLHQPQPPGPRLTLLDALLLTTGRRDLPTFLLELAQTYGDVVHFKVGSRQVTLLNHPDYIRDVVNGYYEYFLKARPANERKFLGNGLLTSESENHRRRRRMIRPNFHKEQVAAAERVIIEHATRLREGWCEGQPIDMMRQMKFLTLTMTCKTLFDVDVRFQADEIMRAMDAIVSQFSLLGAPLRKLQALLPASQDRRRQKAQKRLDAIVQRIIAERRQNGARGTDLLSGLFEAEAGGEPEGLLTDMGARDEVLIFLMAGHETLAMALTWTWYLLAQHPEVEAQLHAELDQVLGDRAPSVADIPHLTYTRMVLSEAMRLYPPAWCLVRYVAKDYRVNGYVLPAGSFVMFSPYVMHRDRRYFPDPARFDPLRWTAKAKATRPQYSYFPFGGGPRGCIAESLAWTQGILSLACLAQRWQLRLPRAYQAAVNPGIILRPKNGMPMVVTRRTTPTSN